MSGKYALIVANTEYTDPGLLQLKAPGKDAEDFARVLRSPDIASFDKVFTLINRDVFIVNQAIEDFFTGKKPGDLLLLYFSGHGVRDENGALYLAVKNTNRGRLRSTAIKADFIREAMDHSRAKRLVLILDCCNSGAFAQGSKAATGVSIGTATAFEGTGYGRIVLTASDSTQYAWEGDQIIGDTENSLFTHFLVKGLEGEADLDGDGRITVDELYDYAYEQIVSCTPKQTPGKWSYKQQGEIILRQSKGVEEFRPTRLPADLLAATENTLPYVREGAVRQLGELLKGKNLGLAQAARATLEKIAAEDDSRYVASAAKKVLESAVQVVHEQTKSIPVIAEAPAAERIEPPPRKKMEDDRIMEKRAAAVRKARQRESAAPASQPVAAPLTKKEPERKSKRSATVLTIVLLSGISLLIYATVNLLGGNPLIAPPSTETSPPTFEQSTVPPISQPLNTVIPTDPPASVPVTFSPPPTSIPPTSIPPTSIRPAEIEIPSDPNAFIFFYFDNVNNRNYDLTWSLLSDRYKAKTNPEGQNQYINFWNGYNKVEVTSVEHSYLTSTSFKTTAKVKLYKGSTASSHTLTYYLTSDNSRGIWMFDVAPSPVGSASDTTCQTVPKRLSIGISAKVSTATDPLLLRETPSEGASVLERMPPGTVVTVLDGPTCGTYRSVNFWWWKVRAPSGKTGWVVEGSDVTDLIFIQPAQ